METTVSLAEELGMTNNGICNRAHIIGITKTSREWSFTDKEADMIRNYKRKIPVSDRYHKRKIGVIDFFLSRSNNTILEISNIMELPVSKIHEIINEWCENDHYIVVESKINE
jgi:hypothetical protein